MDPAQFVTHVDLFPPDIFFFCNALPDDEGLILCFVAIILDFLHDLFDA